MRIEPNTSVVISRKSNSSNIDTNVDKTQKQPNEQSYSELAHKPVQELSIDEKNWIELIEKANKAITGANKSFEYSIHEQTKQIVVKVIDKETDKVIGEIPSEKILDMVAKMWEMAGLIVDERR